MSDTKQFFESTLADKISNDQEKAKGIGAVFFFDIEGDGGGQWTVNLKDDPSVKDGKVGEPECSIKTTSETWNAIIADPSTAMGHFFSGALKVDGNPMLATKLQELLS